MDNQVRSSGTSHRPVVLFLCIYAVLITLTLNNTKPFKGDESFYITSSIRMIESGNYLVPEYFGSVRLQKPILPYWLTAAGYRVFGIHLWSGRLVFLALSLLLLISVYRFSLYLSAGDTAYAFMHVVLLATAPLFIGFTRHAMCDLPYTLFATLSLFGLVRTMRREHGLIMAYTGAWAWAGLACISKCLLGALPIAAYMLWMFIERPDGWKRRTAHLFHPLCIAVFLLIIAPWYIYVWRTEPIEFARQLMNESETLSLSVTGAISNVLYYLWGLIRMYIPFPLIAGFIFIKYRPTLKREYGPLLIFVLLMLLFFVCAVARQRERYLLVVFPALTMLMGDLLYRRGWYRTVINTAGALLVLEAVVLLAYPAVAGEQVKELVTYWRVNADGDLSLHDMPRRKISWAQALSGGKVRIDDADTAWIITTAGACDSFPSYTVMKTSEIINTVQFRDGRLIPEKDMYCLIRNENP